MAHAGQGGSARERREREENGRKKCVIVLFCISVPMATVCWAQQAWLNWRYVRKQARSMGSMNLDPNRFVEAILYAAINVFGYQSLTFHLRDEANEGIFNV